MRGLLIAAAAGEAATGVALLVAPSLVGRLLLGADLTGPAVTVAGVAGIALVALGIACWPGTPRLGILVYGAAVALYLAHAGLSGTATGPLLWPAVGLHGLLTVLLLRAKKGRRAAAT